MFLVRLIGLASAMAIGLMVLMWLATGERRWLHRAWLLFRIALGAVVLILLLFLGEAAFRA